MTATAVIYEVTAEVDAEAGAEFDAWLTQCLEDMLKLPGFLEAKILRPQADADSVQERPRIQRIIQYTLASRSDLDTYLRDHSARIQAEAGKLFGDRLRTRQRILDIRGHELKPVGEIKAVSDTALQQGTLKCLNCGAMLTGKFCANCGQINHTYAAPLFSVIEDFFGNHFGFDTKFFHSLLPLLFRPGFLSREYSEGRRVRYINPLRLYIFSSIVLFFLAWSVASPQLARFDNPGAGSNGTISFSNNPLTAPTQSQSRNIKKKSPATGQNNQSGNSNATQADNTMSGEVFGKKFAMSKTEFKARLIHDFETYLPKMMFLFLPLVALLLKLFYIRSKRYYMEHLIFTLHNHAFVYIAMIFILLAGILARHIVWLTSPVGYFKDILGWYMVIYIFLAMWFYYRQSFFKTLIKFLLIGFIYWLLLTTTFVLGVMLIFTEVLAI